MPFCRNLVDPYSHIFPILRERAAHMPYKYLESFKTIFLQILTTLDLVSPYVRDRHTAHRPPARAP